MTIDTYHYQVKYYNYLTAYYSVLNQKENIYEKRGQKQKMSQTHHETQTHFQKLSLSSTQTHFIF